MPLSRRDFVQTLSIGAASGWIVGRGVEASAFGVDLGHLFAVPAGSPLILDSNENPVGPYKPVADGVLSSFDATNRYPAATVQEVTAIIAKANGVKPENVLLGTGSTPLLQSAVQLFTSKDRPLVEPQSTFEAPGSYARVIGTPIKTSPMTSTMHFDLDALVDASKGAGVVYFCNPNNPTANGVDGKDTKAFIDAVSKASPDTTILFDEAYFHYAMMPGFETMMPIAVLNPRVIVARTFSKAFGMAGLRLGYVVGHKDTIAKMTAWDGPGTVNVLALAGARAAFAMDPKILQDERKRNTDVRAFTTKWFADRGYTATDSQANFIFVDVKRANSAFQAACLKEGVRTGRNFPPYTNYSRITIGTMDEMQKAVKMFERVLAAPAIAA